MDPPKKCDDFAALAAVILFGAMTVVQLLIASEILPITIILGGGSQDTALTVWWLRLASIVAACILLGMAYLILV